MGFLLHPIFVSQPCAVIVMSKTAIEFQGGKLSPEILGKKVPDDCAITFYRRINAKLEFLTSAVCAAHKFNSQWLAIDDG